MFENPHCIQEENHKTRALLKIIEDMGKKKMKQVKKKTQIWEMVYEKYL